MVTGVSSRRGDYSRSPQRRRQRSRSSSYRRSASSSYRRSPSSSFRRRRRRRSRSVSISPPARRRHQSRRDRSRSGRCESGSPRSRRRGSVGYGRREVGARYSPEREGERRNDGEMRRGRCDASRQSTARASTMVELYVDDEERSCGWQRVTVSADATVLDVRQAILSSGVVSGARAATSLILSTEAGTRLFSAMTLAEAGLQNGSRVVWRSSGSGNGSLRELLQPQGAPPPTSSKGKTYALEMAFGGGPPQDPYARELDLVNVELPSFPGEQTAQEQSRSAGAHKSLARAFVRSSTGGL